MLDSSLEYILDVIAQAQASRKDPYDILVEGELTDLPQEVLHRLIKRGMSAISGDRNYYARVESKVLVLNPQHYMDLQATIAARPSPKITRKDRERAAQAEVRHVESRKYMRKLEAAMALYDSWVLSDGTHLGDATAIDLEREASVEETNAAGHLRNVQFYRDLAALVPSGLTVAQAVPLADAHRMRERAYQPIE